jgi:hypothetical protein
VLSPMSEDNESTSCIRDSRVAAPG